MYGERGPGRRRDLLDQRHEPPDVIAGRKLGHDAAVARVQVDLRMEAMGEQAPGRVEDGHAGLVAGGLDAEDAHGGGLGTGRTRP